MTIPFGGLICVCTFAFCLLLGGPIDELSAAEQDGETRSNPGRKEVLFEDTFERSDLGNQYEILNPDPNRFAVTDGKLVLVASEPLKNLVLLQKSFPADFVATAAVTMPVTEHNHVALYYWVDEENFLVVGIAGSDGCHSVPWGKIDCSWGGPRRQPLFTKVVGGDYNNIVMHVSTLGNRSLAGYSEKPEPWYLQLRREGIKYTGQISVDGVRWTDLGTHVIVQRHGRLGLAAGSGGNIENAAEFDELVVQE